MSHHILVVEDDENLSRTIPRFLIRQGYRATLATSLAEARRALDSESPDLVLLDRLLPDGSGLDLLECMRTTGDARPVIITTALQSEAEQLDGFAAGANDYVIKPFSFPLLQERIRAWLRASPRASDVIKHDASTGRVMYGPSSMDLAHKESSLLSLLMAYPNQLQRRSDLHKAWTGSASFKTRTVDQYVFRLRGKLRAIGLPNAIVTARGGYIWSLPGTYALRSGNGPSVSSPDCPS